MNKVVQVIKYLRYLISSDTKHDIHSPFIFKLLTEVIEKDLDRSRFKRIEKIRKKMLSSKLEIEVKDLGAGSKVSDKSKRKVSDIARHSLKSPKYARLLNRLVKHFEPGNIIELGTSLGITSLYLSEACPSCKIFTLEGCTEIAGAASQNFREMNCKNINLIQGNFDDTYPLLLEKIKSADFVFFDGNHRSEPTINYFLQSLPYINNDSVFVFDDIHWSGEMEKAWQEIITNPLVTATIDLHFLGIVFFRKELQKQDFIIRF